MEISFDIFDISFDKVGIAAAGDVQPAVGTLGLSVRCVKGYSIVVLTGTDAQTVRPYNGLLVSLVRGRVTRIDLIRRATRHYGSFS